MRSGLPRPSRTRRPPKWLAALVERGLKVVDLSADFRLKSAETYEQWYKVEHKRPDLLPEAVYGLPELYASDIAKARLVANPGCYPTSIILGMTAALADGLIETHGIVADSKSGVSGAGRSAKLGSLYCEVADSFKAYGIGTHRHTPEIEQELSRLAHGPMTISFNPHLVPHEPRHPVHDLRTAQGSPLAGGRQRDV